MIYIYIYQLQSQLYIYVCTYKYVYIYIYMPVERIELKILFKERVSVIINTTNISHRIKNPFRRTSEFDHL